MTRQTSSGEPDLGLEDEEPYIGVILSAKVVPPTKLHPD